MSRSKPYEALMKRLQEAKNRGRKQSKVSSTSISQISLKDDWFDELLSSSSQLWICSTCTFQNDVKYNICEMCGDNKLEDKDGKSPMTIIFEELENIYAEIDALKEKNAEEKHEDSLVSISKRECQNLTDKIFEILYSISPSRYDKNKESLKDYLDVINEQIESLISDKIIAFYYKLYHQTLQGGVQGICYFITSKDIYELSIYDSWDSQKPFLNQHNIKRIYYFNEASYGSYMDVIISISMSQSEVKELQFIRGSDGYLLQFDASKYIKEDKEKFRSLYTKIPGKELSPLPPLWLEVRSEKGDIEYVNIKTFKKTGVRPDK